MVKSGLIEDIKITFKDGNMLTKLIYVNLGVFLLIKIVTIVIVLFNIGSASIFTEWLSVPADVIKLLYKPWTLITYMFLHEEFLHILFNLLWLFWFGKIFLEYFTDKQLLNIYLLGGLSGAFLYIISYNLLPIFSNVLPFSSALGASAAVMAIVISTAVYVPNYTVYLMFFGPVKLKYIALVSVLLDVVLLLDGNSGGHIAHIGGAIFGYYYTIQFKKGREIFSGFSNIVDNTLNLFKYKNNLKVTYKRSESDINYKKRKNTEQKDIDKILEKISKSGYNSLSKEEKEILFRQSRNN